MDVTKFKYENLKTVSEFIEKNDEVGTFDLKHGYHHIPIAEEDQKYLGFSWTEGGKTRYFVFVVLPFGLASACYAFTKLMRPLVKKWRGNGMKVAVYLDDGIFAAHTFEICSNYSIQIQKDLKHAGLTINFKVKPGSILWLGSRYLMTKFSVFQCLYSLVLDRIEKNHIIILECDVTLCIFCALCV